MSALERMIINRVMIRRIGLLRHMEPSEDEVNAFATKKWLSQMQLKEMKALSEVSFSELDAESQEYLLAYNNVK